MPTISVRLEEDTQLIVAKIDGPICIADFERLYVLTEECVNRLSDPEIVRILLDARNMDRSLLATRRRGIEVLRNKSMTRMAFWGASGFARIMQRMIMTVIGESRVGTFATEQEARKWLLR